MTGYLGIDFANKDTNIGRCRLKVDDTQQLITPTITMDQPEENDYVAVDCPFGTSEGFQRLLMGQRPDPCEWDNGLKTRQTENWLREVLWNYSTNDYWRGQNTGDGRQYVNKTAHVQSSVGLVIVPAFLNWAMYGHNQKFPTLQHARCGETRLVEAHPRAFLYSIVERIFRAIHGQNQSIDWQQELQCVLRYKDKNRESHLRERSQVYTLLQTFSAAWLWDGLSLADPEPGLLQTDHAFDAFLAALTAFAFARGQTITYWQAGISRERALVEGHIAILTQLHPAPPQGPDVTKPSIRRSL